MAAIENGSARTAEWLKPRAEQQGLQRYLATIREHIRLIVIAVIVTTAAAAAYVELATPVYQAQAQMLVSTLPSSATGLVGFGLIEASSDPTRDVQTASTFITNTSVADGVKQLLADPRSPRQLLKQVTAIPVAQSNIVAITASASTPGGAQRLANAFARATVEVRTRELDAQLDSAIAQLQGQLASLPATAASQRDAIAAQISELETLRAGPDPTLRLQQAADTPTSPSSPKRSLSLAAGVLIGLVLGVGGAFALEMLDPRLKREQQLRELFDLPILARIPNEPGHRHGALLPQQLSHATVEAYRTLRATLSAFPRRSSSGGRADRALGGRSILVTGGSPAEGKTTTAINLASSLALAGNSVILIEADLRRPSIGRALGVSAEHGTLNVLFGSVELEEALVSTELYGPRLRLLLAHYTSGTGGWMADRLLPGSQQLIAQAQEVADYVIIDSPPLAEVIDALAMAQQVDDVLVIARLGHSRLAKISELAELLARHGVRPAGFALVGAPVGSGEGYYYGPGRGRARRGQRRDGRSGQRAPAR